jgi:hypothetical protein
MMPIYIIYAIYFQFVYNILPRKITKTDFIIAQNFQINNANLMYIRYVFLNYILIFLTRKRAKPLLF